MLYLAGAKHVEILGNEITKASISAISSAKVSHDIRLLGNWIHDNGTNATFDHGIYWSLGTGGVIANNVIEKNRAFGIHLYPDANNILVTSNTVVGNGKSGILVAGNAGSSSDGNTIVNNIVASNTEYGIRSYWSGAVGSGNSVMTNLGYGNWGRVLRDRVARGRTCVFQQHLGESSLRFELPSGRWESRGRPGAGCLLTGCRPRLARHARKDLPRTSGPSSFEPPLRPSSLTAARVQR